MIEKRLFWQPIGTLYIAELRYFAVYIRTGGAEQAAFHGMGRFVHDGVRVSFPVHTYIVLYPNSQIYGD